MVEILDRIKIENGIEFGISHFTGKITPTFFGIDVGKGDDLTIVSFYPEHHLRLKDKLTIYGYSHKHVHYVKRILDKINIEPGHYIKPSRGFARHIRRMKCLKA